jgi:DNA-binding LytR/AlgR family response regulator
MLLIDCVHIISTENIRICFEEQQRSLNHLLREKMDLPEKKLNLAKFVRIHRSAITNVDYINEVKV